MRKLTTLVIHHSATAAGRVEQFDREHRARGFAKIGYHTVIGNGRGMPDGALVVGRRDADLGAGVYGANTGKLHVCLVGNFHRPDSGFTGTPSRAQLDMLGEWLLRKSWDYAGRFAKPPLEVAGHNEVALKTHPTACPGSEFPMAAVRRWFEHYAMVWRPGDVPAVSLGSFVERGGALSLLDEVARVTEQPRSRGVRVLRADGTEVEVPPDDWRLVDGQTFIRLRALCTAAGLPVETDGAGVLVRADR